MIFKKGELSKRVGWGEQLLKRVISFNNSGEDFNKLNIPKLPFN